MNNKLITTLAAVALIFVGATAATPVYLDPSKPLEERVEDALQRMTLEEKVGVLHAQSKFCSRGVQRLGIPELWTTDGPHGIRPEVLWDEWEQAAWTNDSCVAFPALTALAATWNPELAELYGRSLGEEALYRGKDVVLGPGVNIYRTPLNGRNFEYMGEDPLLASRMVVPYIKGLQSNGVAACVKHYALNNNEVNRHTSNVIVDDRTLYEIYLPAFKAAVTEGGAWSIMGSYNLYQNQHGCHNKRLLCDILRDEWGFDGVVISDWGGTHDTAEAVENGLDLEFGSWTNGLTNGRSNAYDNYYLANPYLKLLREGKADMATLDNKVRNVLRLIFRTAMKSDKGFGSLCSDEHYAAARRIGAEGIVLLRNKDNLLPLDPSKPQNILVVGENAVKMMTVGGGSSSLKVQRETSPLDGLRAQAPAGSTVVWERGYVGDPTGEYNGVTSGQDLSESRSADRLIADAADAARRADVVIFVGGLNKATGQDCEDSDRESLALPYNQDAVIEALVAANPRTVVVNVSGNAVAMPWADKVPAILQAWFLGSESGNSLADVIFGRVNPSGKLPMTFPVRLDDVAAHAVGEYPGTKRADSDIVDIRYNEGVMVGYRWFDTRKIRPLFAFGHGLSYTTFGYGKLSADASKIGPDGALTLSVDVTNTGSRAGAETVQLYISDTKASVKRPAKELKNFAKIYLEPGQTKTLTFTVRPSDLAFFDAGAHAWKAEPGEFRAHVGAASDDIRSSLRFVLTD
ncbi:glycosyl hydrolase family 3 N-terminal domain protein [Prevotella sp. CAG:1031]|nr:glycosyl hydrolase family 3 N-terminal domain protein [Prevotella sp. CAG:1031]